MLRFVGPLPVDPVLGTDARQQAKTRLNTNNSWRRGFSVRPPMSVDAATAFLDSSETQARAIALNRAEQVLRNMGFSDEGIMKMIIRFGSLGDSLGTGVERYGDSVETRRHALNGLSKADAELFSKWGGKLGTIGNVAQLVIARIDWFDGGEPATRISARPSAVARPAGWAVWPRARWWARSQAPSTAAGAAIIGGRARRFRDRAAGSEGGSGNRIYAVSHHKRRPDPPPALGE